MLKKLHKRKNTTVTSIEPNEGERTLLCSNESGMRSPSLDLEHTFSQEEKMLLEQLAGILAEAIIWESIHGIKE
jgi:hypothetical protein